MRVGSRPHSRTGRCHAVGWFFGSVVGFIGLVISIVAAASDSGRRWGIAGIVLAVALPLVIVGSLAR